LRPLPYDRILSACRPTPDFGIEQARPRPVDRGIRYPTAFQDPRRETTMRAPRARDHAFFRRVAHGNNVQADLMKRSVTKLDESLKLLAEVSHLLHR
jgi:hypothetical protein